jgi:hypothetical protein
MSDGHSARRGVQTAGTQSAPGRTRLGKREWQDIRRACKLGIDGELHAVDLHGVRLTFRCQRACSGPAQDMASTSSGQEGQAAGRRNATAQRPATNPTGPSDGRRHRQGKGKQGSTRAHKPGRACTTAGEPRCRQCRWHWTEVLQYRAKWETLGTAVPGELVALAGTDALQCWPAAGTGWNWALQCR